jgi:hypothetical protein
LRNILFQPAQRALDAGNFVLMHCHGWDPVLKSLP